MFEDTIAQGKTTPLHLHPEEEEAVYVIEGELLVHVDGKDHQVRAGGLAVVPRGVAHAFLCYLQGRCGSSRSCRRERPSPSTGEQASPATSETDPSGPVDFNRLRQSADLNGGIEILGPPPFDKSQIEALVATG